MLMWKPSGGEAITEVELEVPCTSAASIESTYNRPSQPADITCAGPLPYSASSHHLAAATVASTQLAGAPLRVDAALRSCKESRQLDLGLELDFGPPLHTTCSSLDSDYPSIRSTQRRWRQDSRHSPYRARLHGD